MRRDKKAGGGGVGEGPAAAAADDEEAVAFTITPTLESLICVCCIVLLKSVCFTAGFLAVGRDCVFSFCFLLFVRSWRRKVYNPFCFSFW